MGINSYRRQWLRYHNRYELRTFRLFHKSFKKFARNIDFDNMTLVNYVTLIDQAIDEEELLNNIETVNTKIGLLHGKRVGKEFNEQLKLFTLGDFTSTFIEFIKDWLVANGGWKIELLKRTFRESIVQIIAEGINEGLGINDIARNLQRVVNRRDFYRWQSMRIARTESTAAANRGALQAGKITGFKTNKMWISAQDTRTRRLPEDKFDHLQMHLKQVDISEMFEVPSLDKGFELMEYPGDGGTLTRQTSAGNVINCRCTVAIVPARDRQGRLIPD